MFENTDYESILERLLSRVSDKIDKREGSVIYDALAPAALEIADVYVVLQTMMDEMFADTASYEYLAKRAAERGVYPKEETYAVCKMIVEPIDTPVSIGDRFNLNTLNYAVTAKMDDGAYQVTCETAGTIGNQQLGNLLTIETQNDLNDMQSAELTEVLIPGEDDEDVEDFRQRYFGSLVNEAFGGNKADYREKINNIEGVGASKTVRMWKKGYNPSKFLPSTAVTEWVDQQSADTVGQEVYTWLGAIYEAAMDKLLTVGGTVRCQIISSEFKAPSATLVKKVQDAVDPDTTTGEGDGLAPIGHVVKVVGVRSEQININFTGVYKSGQSFASLEEAIQKAVDAYFLELAESWSAEDYLVVRKSRVESKLLTIDGILDITDLKLNGTSDNVTLDEDAIPVRGDVSG